MVLNATLKRMMSSGFNFLPKLHLVTRFLCSLNHLNLPTLPHLHRLSQMPSAADGDEGSGEGEEEADEPADGLASEELLRHRRLPRRERRARPAEPDVDDGCALEDKDRLAPLSCSTSYC